MMLFNENVGINVCFNNYVFQLFFAELFVYFLLDEGGGGLRLVMWYKRASRPGAIIGSPYRKLFEMLATLGIGLKKVICFLTSFY